jgi:hypothetical protein
MTSKSRRKFASAPSAPSAIIIYQGLAAGAAHISDRPRKTDIATEDAIWSRCGRIADEGAFALPSACNRMNSNDTWAWLPGAADADAKLSGILTVARRAHFEAMWMRARLHSRHPDVEAQHAQGELPSRTRQPSPTPDERAR